MGCSNDNSVKLDNEETNQNQEEFPIYSKDFPDFEEYNIKQLIYLF